MAAKIDVQQHDADRMKMLKAFDETNVGVKGIVDSGLQKIPKIFVRPSDELAQELITCHPKIETQVPVIDLSDIQTPEGRKRIVQEVKTASETWGFFQVVNHVIPTAVLDGTIEGIREFHEQDVEEKKNYYSRDLKQSVRFNSSFDLYNSRTAAWRDTLIISVSVNEPVDPQEIPACCRESYVKYSSNLEILGDILTGLFSEALGLETDHLEKMECCIGYRLQGHYYPPCPEPELAIGIAKHSDPGFFAILLQSQGSSALQVLHQGQWVDIHPIQGGLVINIGDLLQLVSNGKFKSNKHRALAIPSNKGPRITQACFFVGPADTNEAKVYGPIKELVSEENPPIYRDVTMKEYFSRFFGSALDTYRGLDEYYKLSQSH